MKKTALVTHEECLQHVTPPGHPEQVARLEYILEALKDINLLRVSAPMAADDDILRIHPREHIITCKTQYLKMGLNPWMAIPIFLQAL